MDEIKIARIKAIDKEVTESTQQLIALEKKILELLKEYISISSKSINVVDKPVMNIHTRGGGK